MVCILTKYEQNVEWGINTGGTKIKNQHEIYDYFTYVGRKMLFLVKKRLSPTIEMLIIFQLHMHTDSVMQPNIHS